MTTMTPGGGRSEALADLSSALTVVATHLETVADTAVRAAAGLIGDCAAIQLVSEGGVHPMMSAHHPDEPRFEALTQLDLAGWSEAARQDAFGSADRPVLLTHPTHEQFRRLGLDVHWQRFEQVGASALLMCPLVSQQFYYGYLALVRTAPTESYSAADIDLAQDVSARTTLAVVTAASVERLRASEERYRHIVETTLDGVWQIDEQAITTFANQRMANLVGLPRQDLIGLPMRGFLDDAGQSRLAARLDLRPDHSEIYDCRLIRVADAPLWVQISTAPLTGPGGRSAGSLSVVTDITERVAARDARRQLDHLRRQDAIGQLAGGIAHDFNNLLTVIGVSAEVLAGEVDIGTTGHQMATQIIKAAMRGGELNHQLLTFGRRSPHTHPVVVESLLTGVRQVLVRAFGDRVALEMRSTPDVWTIHADRGQLEQALVNLATNARDAMSHGGVITIDARNVVIGPGDLADSALTGRFVCLSVSDTGTGMDADTRLHAFEPFYTTKTTRGAAGLGLATVRNMITASGGHVRLQSEPRLGTTVQLYLPIVDQIADQANDRSSPHTDGPRPAGHILVVEDQPELAHLTRYLLQPAGYTVTVTTGAADAVAALAAGLQPDLLLTDVVMPKVTGPELAATLRATNPDLKVLYMSGYTAGVLAPQGHHDTDAALLQKPFNRESLLAAVANAMAR